MSFRLHLRLPPLPEIHYIQKLPLYWVKTSEEPLASLIAIWEAPNLLLYPSGTRKVLLKLIREENSYYQGAELGRKIQRLGWSWGWLTHRDGILLHAEGLRENLRKVLPLLKCAVESPLLRGPHLRHYLRQIAETQERSLASPPYRADAHLARLLWGASYSVTEATLPQDFLKIEPIHLASYHAYYLLQGLRGVVVCAPYIPEEIRDWAGWYGKVSYYIPLPLQTQVREYEEPVPDAQQVSLRLAYPWARSVHPDYGLYRLALLRLGGYFNSQLMQNVREIAGLTYGIYARAEETQAGSYFFIKTEVSRKRVTEAMERIQQEVTAWCDLPFPSTDCIREARNYLIAQLTPESLAEWAQTIGWLIAHRRDIHTYLRQLEQIERIDQNPFPSLPLPGLPVVKVAVGVESLIFAPACT
ncbi:MAG: insulinase family protein [Bacteroidia bacterium]|nr:insulinase family protein [Bacteroidia bacterium]MDW8133798.1 insulinase family protein [Bacteroidia bacterium]